MTKRLMIFVEGDTDKLFFSLLISFLFQNAGKKEWPVFRLKIIPLDGICNADSIIKNEIGSLENKDKFDDTICLIYDTDAFEYQKKPPISIDRVKKISEANNCGFFEIPIEHNVEDMIVFSKKEILNYLRLPSNYIIPKDISGLNLLKKMHKDAGKYYVKGNKSEELLKCLDYSSISKKYCHVLKPLCNYLELGCNNNDFCKIKRK